MDRRQTFKEIVNGFPFANKQKKLIESFYSSTNPNIVTDEDIERYQQTKLLNKKEIGQRPNKKDLNLKSIIQEQKSNVEVQDDISLFKNEKLKLNCDSRDSRKTVYISSRISKWIESLIGNNSHTNMVYQSKFVDNNSKPNMRLSIEGSKEWSTSKRIHASQGKPSFVENTEFGIKRREYGSLFINDNRKISQLQIYNHNASVNDAFLNSQYQNSSLGVSLILEFKIN